MRGATWSGTALTTTVPPMKRGCTRQRYSSAPGFVNVCRNVAPSSWSIASGARPGSESNCSAAPRAALTEWLASGPAHRQLTESPGLTVTVLGR